MSQPANEFPMVRIDWVDSTTSACWTDLPQILSLDDILCHSIGYLVGETPWTYTLSTSLNPVNGSWEWADPFDIPKVAVIAMGVVKEPKLTRRKLDDPKIWEQVQGH